MNRFYSVVEQKCQDRNSGYTRIIKTLPRKGDNADQAYPMLVNYEEKQKKSEVEKIALALLDREVLHQQDVEDLIGKRPFSEKKILADDSSTPEDNSTAPTE